MKKQNGYEYEDYENENEYENQDDDDETIDQNENKKLNDYFGKIIDKSKSFEDQIKSLKKQKIQVIIIIAKILIFKQRLVHLSNKIKEK